MRPRGSGRYAASPLLSEAQKTAIRWAEQVTQLKARDDDALFLRMREHFTDRQIVDFLVARYGDFVLYRPPLKAKTVLLWTGPFLFLGSLSTNCGHKSLPWKDCIRATSMRISRAYS